MGLQKYRADTATAQADNSIHWHANWIGGPSLAKIQNCRIDGSDLRRMVYVTGDPDSYFSQPAACKVSGQVVRGYLTGDDSGMIFHAMDSHRHILDGAAIAARLADIRKAIVSESVSYAEIAELQTIAESNVDALRGDSLLLEWAGVPE